jgi:hypothetical protein
VQYEIVNVPTAYTDTQVWAALTSFFGESSMPRGAIRGLKQVHADTGKDFSVWKFWVHSEDFISVLEGIRNPSVTIVAASSEARQAYIKVGLTPEERAVYRSRKVIFNQVRQLTQYTIRWRNVKTPYARDNSSGKRHYFQFNDTNTEATVDGVVYSANTQKDQQTPSQQHAPNADAGQDSAVHT